MVHREGLSEEGICKLTPKDKVASSVKMGLGAGENAPAEGSNERAKD